LKLERIFIAEMAAVYLTPPILFAILPQMPIDAAAEDSELSVRCRITQQDQCLAATQQPKNGPLGPDVNSRT
jgi:hypothetical protein